MRLTNKQYCQNEHANKRAADFVAAKHFLTSRMLDNFVENCVLQINVSYLRRIALTRTPASCHPDMYLPSGVDTALEPDHALACAIIRQAIEDYHNGLNCGH